MRLSSKSSFKLPKHVIDPSKHAVQDSRYFVAPVDVVTDAYESGAEDLQIHFLWQEVEYCAVINGNRVSRTVDSCDSAIGMGELDPINPYAGDLDQFLSVFVGIVEPTERVGHMLINPTRMVVRLNSLDVCRRHRLHVASPAVEISASSGVSLDITPCPGLALPRIFMNDGEVNLRLILSRVKSDSHVIQGTAEIEQDISGDVGPPLIGRTVDESVVNPPLIGLVLGLMPFGHYVLADSYVRGNGIFQLLQVSLCPIALQPPRTVRPEPGHLTLEAHGRGTDTADTASRGRTGGDSGTDTRAGAS